MQKQIVALSSDPRDRFALIVTIDHEPGDARFDTVESCTEALKAAVREYAETPAGRKHVQIRRRAFNIGDLVEEIPNGVCRRHGFTIVNTAVTNLITDHDETLYD